MRVAGEQQRRAPRQLDRDIGRMRDHHAGAGQCRQRRLGRGDAIVMCRRIVEAAQRKRPEPLTLIDQHEYADPPQHRRDRCGIGPVIVIAEYRDDPQRGLQLRQRACQQRDRPLRLAGAAPLDEITGQHDQIGVERINLPDDAGQPPLVHRHAFHVDIAHQRDGDRRFAGRPVGQRHRHPANDRIGAGVAIADEEDGAGDKGDDQRGTEKRTFHDAGPSGSASTAPCVRV
ncbi:hypothetical protein WR25_26395 [Diploscapter pachys]|uniref:Uncharacterized protein n=1 Tax=Diploscapter pachys TaxID=2018661 RepID=A0A2A2M366_9BILA|nr:hypothetical protein WR25_26395 [Diploscapter pachys]